MAVVPRCWVTLSLWFVFFSVFAGAQTGSPSEVSSARSLPDIATLMHEVEANQRRSEALLKDYIYREVAVGEQNDGHGGVKKTVSREYDVFWIDGVQVHKMIRKDGKDLSANELKKEDKDIDEQVAKAKEKRVKADAEGRETDSRGEEEVTVSRLLTLGSFTNPRRVTIDGRDTIAVDFTGDPRAKTKGRLEDIIHDLSGTVWIDEQDKQIVRSEGHFAKAYKIGGGLIASVKEGTSFSFEQKKINDEVWLPFRLEAEGAFRALLFVSFNGHVLTTTSDYRKFKTTSTILPGLEKVETPDASSSPR